MAKAIIFDIDGVLADSDDLHVRAESSVLDKFGVKLSDKEWLGYKGIDENVFWTGLSDKYNLGMDHLALAEQKRAAFFRIAEGIKSFKGVHQLITSIKQQGLPIGVASSSDNAVVDYILTRLDLKQYFDVIVSGNQIENGKPAPDIFLKAAALLRNNPSECVVFEESVNGVKAAKSAGMSCIAVTNTFPKDNLSGADLIVRSLDDLDVETIKRL